MQQADLKAQLVLLIEDGKPESVADAMIMAARTPIDPPAAVEVDAETAEGSRDETHDSIDPATGGLTAAAVAKRAADKAADDVADAELAVAKAKRDKDKDALAEAEDALAAAQVRADATQKALDDDDVVTLADGTVVQPGQALNSDATGLLGSDVQASTEPAGDAGGAMVTVDPNDPAIDAPSTVPATFGVVNKSTDVNKKK